MLSDHTPDRHITGTDVWGPERTSSLRGEEGVKRGGILDDPAALQGAGISGGLDYDLALQPGEGHTLRFALAGGMDGATCARQNATELLAEYDSLLHAKLAGQDALIGGESRIETPEPDMDRVYALQNLCMDMLTFEMPGVARGAVAGLPSFAWYFGCDTYYSISGLLVAGQAETAMSNLRLLANYAREQGGRIPHEITQTGRLFNPGNTVETAEFVTSVERVYRWTGDRVFLHEMYGVCKEGVFDYLLGECDPEHTYLPDGPGLLELRSAGRGRKLDVAAALHQALRSLAYLGCVAGDSETVTRCREVRLKVRESMDRHFWLEDRGEYVWRIEHDLSVYPEEPAHSYVMLEMGVLDGSTAQDAARADSLFAKVEGPEHTGPKGIIHPGTSDFVMPVGNAMVALAEFEYGRPDRGLWYLQRMAELCDRGMPWAIPEFEIKMHSSYKPCFLQLWSSAAYNWLAVQGWFRLLPDPDRGEVLVRPQLPTDWEGVKVKNLALWGERYDLALQRVDGKIQLIVEPLSQTAGNPFHLDDTSDMPVIFV
jgi:glycogen debranching enzyme